MAIALSLSILLPIAVAFAAVRLALTCKYHPLTQAVIIPDADLKEQANPAEAEELASDLDSRHKLMRAVGIALGIVLVMSMMLWVLSHPEYFEDFLEPLVRVLSHMDYNTLLATMVVFPIALQVLGIARTFTWITPWRGVLIGVACAAVLSAWLLVDSWITLNLAAALICLLGALSFQTRISFLRLSLIMLIASILYDAWQVYGTQDMQKYAASVTPQIGEPERVLAFPALFMFPGELSLHPFGYAMLGAGDVMVLGIMAISAARLGKKLESQVPLLLTMAGFAVAMAVATMVVHYTDFAQPATIYIVPLCALPVIVFARLRGRFDQLSMPFYAAAPKKRKHGQEDPLPD
jgi:presenilin-like A22 family membrane protease